MTLRGVVFSILKSRFISWRIQKYKKCATLAVLAGNYATSWATGSSGSIAVSMSSKPLSKITTAEPSPPTTNSTSIILIAIAMIPISAESIVPGIPIEEKQCSPGFTFVEGPRSLAEWDSYVLAKRSRNTVLTFRSLKITNQDVLNSIGALSFIQGLRNAERRPAAALSQKVRAVRHSLFVLPYPSAVVAGPELQHSAGAYFSFASDFCPLVDSPGSSAGCHPATPIGQWRPAGFSRTQPQRNYPMARLPARLSRRCPLVCGYMLLGVSHHAFVRRAGYGGSTRSAAGLLPLFC